MGRVVWASEVFNCSAPDTGNMELLHLFATPAQREQWLSPLLNGEIRSCFAMTEPDVASSDATNIRTRVRRDGDHYVIDGRKWFITGAADPRCKICILMGVTDPDAEPHARHSMVLVPMDTARRRGGAQSADHAPHRAGRALRDAFFRSPGAGLEPFGRRGPRLRARPGAARPRPHPPLHALDRPVRAGARADVRPRPRARDVREEAARARPGRRMDRARRARRSTRRASWCCARPGGSTARATEAPATTSR